MQSIIASLASRHGLSRAEVLLEVAIKADTAACRVDGVTLFEHRAANSYHGHVGLWTKADSVTLFTGLTIENG